MAEKLLELKNISKRFGGVQALDNVGFDIKKQEIHCLVGENGSGKSTLIKIISGVLKPEPGGTIIFDGKKITHQSSMESVKRGIQVIYQDLSLFPNLTVAENIAFNVHIEENRFFVRWSEIVDIARKAMEKIAVDLDPEELVGRLSVADRQLVAICRAMIADAKLVIMDEPTASLSKKEVENLFKVIKDLQSKGVSTLFVSHKLNEIMEIAERVTVLRDGKKVGVYQAEELDNEKLTYLMTGKKFSYSKLTKDFTNSDDVLLEIRHLSKKNNYKDINLTLHKGEIIGITGLLGSGRTELALSLFGMNEPDEGEILIEGKSVNLKSHEEAIKHGIGYVPEDRLSQGLVMDQSVGKNIIITILNRLLGKWNLLDRNKQDWETKKWVDKLSIKIPSIEAPVRTLSGGNQQRVVLAKWIATNPKILILDSPTVGVDIAAKDSIYEIVRRLASEGIGIIMISDEIEEVLYHSHIVYVMKAGRIIGKYRSDRITERELYEKANAKD